jgi:hypothetical protein
MAMLLPSSQRRISMVAHAWEETGLEERQLSTAGSPAAALGTEAAVTTRRLLPCRAVISSHRNAPWSHWGRVCYLGPVEPD